MRLDHACKIHNPTALNLEAVHQICVVFRDYCEGLRDSLDLVPIGAWWGQGRKTGWFSPFLMAAWDPEKEEYQSVCRCMSGFTDLFYTEVMLLTQIPSPQDLHSSTRTWPKLYHTCAKNYSTPIIIYDSTRWLMSFKAICRTFQLKSYIVQLHIICLK